MAKKFPELKKEMEEIYVERQKLESEVNKLQDMLTTHKKKFDALYREIETYHNSLDKDAVESETGPTLYDLADEMYHYDEYGEHGHKQLDTFARDLEDTQHEFKTRYLAKMKMASIRKVLNRYGK
jgi:predicted nuclease with TOPRIM domain